MNEIEQKIYDEYVRQAELFFLQYHIMGSLLDKRRISEVIKNREWNSIYIYGGGYIGVQLYNAISRHVNVKAIIDKEKHVYVPIKNLEVLSLKESDKMDINVPVIITPIEHERVIYEDLKHIFDESYIYYINELLL